MCGRGTRAVAGHAVWGPGRCRYGSQVFKVQISVSARFLAQARELKCNERASGCEEEIPQQVGKAEEDWDTEEHSRLGLGWALTAAGVQKSERLDLSSCSHNSLPSMWFAVRCLLTGTRRVHYSRQHQAYMLYFHMYAVCVVHCAVGQVIVVLA
jgi:hypothetical protein